ncbi:MAG TPA: antibiotic biosynthesis monooxygenase family protein [Thermomicrobiales bacterium]|jgi:heme-degrading monooxygenase HmoA
MSSNADLSSRGAMTNAPIRSRTTSPVTTTGRSSDMVPIVGRFALLQRFNLSQGYAELAEELTDRVAPIMRRQPGFISLTLLSDETSGEYIFLTHWEDLERLNAFERSADEWRIRDIMSEHLTTVPQIEVYQLHNLSGAAAEEATASE